MKLYTPETREIDCSQTRKNVAKWFDVEYSKYQRLANIPVISSVRLSLAPRGTASANSVEDMNVNRANARQVLEFVEAVINSLGDYKPFLEARYIKKLQSWQIEERLGFGHSQTQTRIRKACALFAQTMDMTAGTNLVAYKETSDNER